MAVKEGTKKNLTLKDFKGVNTQAARWVIGDDEFAWLEDAMPVGFGNLKVVPGPSAAVASVTSGSCYYMDSGNISNVNYMFMFSSDGSAYQINLSSFAKTTIGGVGTFSTSGARITQWKNERMLIIDPAKGYFDWNGTTLTSYSGTIFSASIVAGGINFTSSPTITPASGSATFAATIGCTLATLVGGGATYSVGDVLTVSGGTFSRPAQLTVSTVTAGAITGFNISDTGDYTIAPGNPASVTGGHGSGATFTLNFSITKVLVLTPGSGYVSAPGLTVSGGAGSGASLTANLSNSTNGTTIATFAGRVWIANGRTVVFSAPNSYQDFTTASFGGSFIMSDSVLVSNINRLFAANNYLYIFGLGSVNVVSDVRVSGSTTVFSNTNISPNIGTDMGDAIVSYYRTIMFANDFGFYGLTGVTPKKISAKLDGMFPNIDLSQSITGGVVIIFGIMCLAFNVKYNDPLTGTARQILAIYFDGKWFFSAQVSGLKFTAQSMANDVPTMFGTDGTSLYQLFAQQTASQPHTIRTKLWDAGDPLMTKQLLKHGLESVSSSQPATITISIETETRTTTTTSTASNVMTWYNSTGGTIAWTNNSSQPITWLASGYVFLRKDITNFGNYFGTTITCSTPGVIYSGIHFQYEFRTPWTGVPF